MEVASTAWRRLLGECMREGLEAWWCPYDSGQGQVLPVWGLPKLLLVALPSPPGSSCPFWLDEWILSHKLFDVFLRP